MPWCGRRMSVSAERSGTPQWVASFALLGVFALGIVSGAALWHLAQRSGPHPPPPWRERPGPRRPLPPGAELERMLDLAPEQAANVRAILEESRERMHQEAEATRARILEVLTPEQREIFETLRPPRPPFPGEPEFGDRPPPGRGPRGRFRPRAGG